LTSGHLPEEKTIDIWNKFLEFESSIGDLSSIIKTEKRRSAVLNQIKEFDGRETAQIIDRYRFQNLYPCSNYELKSIGYNEVLALSSNPNKQLLPVAAENAETEEDEEDKIIRPDFSQMIPFKPKVNAYPGEHPVPGGTFPMPPVASHFISILPAAQYFHGPFVAVDQLISLITRLQLPDSAPIATGEGVDPGQFDIAKSVHWVANPDKHEDDGHNDRNKDFPQNPRGRRNFKRKLQGQGNNQDSEEEDAIAPPPNDIYRNRQQKRVK